jgi:integrase
MRGTIRQRSEGSYSLVYDIGNDPATGKRKQKWATVKGTKKDAERELTRILSALDTGSFVEPQKLTLGAYLEQWLRDYAASNVTGKTFQTYREFITRHLTPGLGHIPLIKLTPSHIQSYYTNKLSHGRLDGKGGLSPRSVLHQHRLLRSALQQALRWQLLARNPADGAVPPKPRRAEPAIVDGNGSLALLEAAAGSWLHVPILLAVTCGMRRGEALALRWEDVNLETGALAVRRSLEQTSQGQVFKSPKSGKSRVIRLTKLADTVLRQHQAAQAEIRRQMGGAWENLDLVVCNDLGAPRSPQALTQAFILLRNRAGATVTFHGLRHSHATILLSQGVQPKVVSERLGHSSIGITQDLYSHVMPHMQEEAAHQVDVAFDAAIEKRRITTLPSA